MAYPNKVVSNRHTGQQIRFLQTAACTHGKLLEMESVFQPFSKEPPAHYHPQQTELFTVLEGTLTVRIDGTVAKYTKGSFLQIAPNAVHAMWNSEPETAVVNWRVEPAMKTEYFLENVNGVANKAGTNNVPPLLQAALLARRFSREFRLARPPYWLQRITFGLLAPVAYLRGYKSSYASFQD